MTEMISWRLLYSACRNPVLSVIPDMWRIRMPSGAVSDMVNVREAA